MVRLQGFLVFSREKPEPTPGYAAPDATPTGADNYSGWGRQLTNTKPAERFISSPLPPQLYAELGRFNYTDIMGFVINSLILIGGIIGGILLMRYNYQLTQLFGHNSLAEKYLGAGGTYSMWRLLGLLTIIGSLFYVL